MFYTIHNLFIKNECFQSKVVGKIELPFFLLADKDVWYVGVGSRMSVRVRTIRNYLNCYSYVYIHTYINCVRVCVCYNNKTCH